MSAKNKTIVLGVTASIAAYKAADIIRRLQEQSYRVSVIMTDEAMKFITPLTLSSLSGEPVHHHMLTESGGDWQMNHIRLAKEADGLLIAPATANTIAKLAHGLADDMLTCTALATQAPLIIAPAMNDGMLSNKIVQENISKLKDLGVTFVYPIEGKLACGTFGEGHLAEVEDIVKAVKTIVP